MTPTLDLCKLVFAVAEHLLHAAWHHSKEEPCLATQEKIRAREILMRVLKGLPTGGN